MGRFADLAGKTAIVTGGGVGIGEAISRGLGENGVDVVVVGRKNREAAERVATDLAALGTRSFALMADVSQEAEVDRIVKTAIDRLGKVDILVNNAGGFSSHVTAVEATSEEWNEIIANNLTSCFLCSRAVLPGMIERKSGRIINISSAAGLMPVSRVHPAYPRPRPAWSVSPRARQRISSRSDGSVLPMGTLAEREVIL